VRALALATGIVVLTGCLDSAGNPMSPTRQVSDVRIALNPYNTLSTVLTFEAVNVDSARVKYEADGEPPHYTACQAVRNDPARIVTLGLRPNTTYAHVVEACGPGAPVVSSVIVFTTGDLPAPLRGVHLQLTGMTYSGYVVLSTRRLLSGFVLGFDGSGEIRWYREFPLAEGEDALDGKQQPNGSFTVFLGASHGWEPTYGRFVEFQPDGQTIRTLVAGAPYYTDGHEILLTADGAGATRVHLFGYDLRRMDLTGIGGAPDVLLAGHTIVRQVPSGSIDFLWSSWDHFALADWIEPPDQLRQMFNIDFDHPNSLDLDVDGNYLASFRHLGEISKIDAVTGRVIWRFGGRNNQFTILNDPFQGFSGQHSVRSLANGNLLVFDNGLRHNPPESRAVEYQLDIHTMTATMVWEYRHVPAVYTPFVGSVQRLASGNTLVGFGFASLMTEVRPTGEVLWEGRFMFDDGPAPFFYRAWKVATLESFNAP
jgi:hypothetical protein